MMVRVYFEAFGKVQSVRLITAIESGKPRGFGFVTFEQETSVEEILEIQTSHIINNTIVDVRPAEHMAENLKMLYAQNPDQASTILSKNNSQIYSKQLGNYRSMWRKNPGHPKMMKIEAKLVQTLKSLKLEISASTDDQTIVWTDILKF